MIYPYHRFVAHPRDQPDKRVTVLAFWKKGAARKARMLLIHMRIIPPDTKPDVLVLTEV